MLESLIPDDIKLASRKATLDLEMQKEGEEKRFRELLSRAEEMLSFLQGIAEEPEITNYLQLGEELKVMTGMGRHGYCGVELRWKNDSPRVTVVFSTGPGSNRSMFPPIESLVDLNSHNLEAMARGNIGYLSYHWPTPVEDMVKTSKEEVWRTIRKQLPRT